MLQSPWSPCNAAMATSCPPEALKELQRQKQNGRAPWWKHLQPGLETENGERRCWLRCVRGGKGVCNARLTTSNVSRTAGEHFKEGSNACKAMVAEEAAARAVRKRGAPSAATGGSSNKQPRVDAHMLPAVQQESANRSLAEFFYHSNVALHLVEQVGLIEQLACFLACFEFDLQA